MGFEWDARKNAANLAKHGIDFEDAIAVFDGPTLERIDTRRDYGEIRIAVIGAANNRVLYLAYTPRGENRRIISARKANEQECESYRQAYPRFASAG